MPIPVTRDPISFDVDVSSEDGGNDNDGGDDKDPGNGNSGEELNDQDPSVRNLNLPAEEYEITCSPKAFTQWLDENADFVLEVMDCVVDEYLYGHALGALDEDLLRIKDSDAGPLTPKRLATCVSKEVPVLRRE
ncbi:hypothetical protein Tco_1350733 [Tanacetum coccineum]